MGADVGDAGGVNQDEGLSEGGVELSDNRFLLVVALLIAAALIALGVHLYAQCQEKGGAIPVLSSLTS